MKFKSLTELLLALPNYEIFGNASAQSQSLRKKCLIRVNNNGNNHDFFWDLTKSYKEQSDVTKNDLNKIFDYLEENYAK